jgi:hypothetical protein
MSAPQVNMARNVVVALGVMMIASADTHRHYASLERKRTVT